MTSLALESPRTAFNPAASGPMPADDSGPTARVRLGILRNQLARPEVHPERALAVTRSYRETEGEPLTTRRGRMLLRIASEHPVAIQEGELIVGMKALTPRGSPVFPEMSCDWVERDLERLATRTNTPFYVSPETKHILRAEVFPYWKGRQVSDRIMEAVPAEIWKADERGVIYNYFRSRTIGHINAGYEKVLRKGMRGIIADIEQALSRREPGGRVRTPSAFSWSRWSWPARPRSSWPSGTRLRRGVWPPQRSTLPAARSSIGSPACSTGCRPSRPPPSRRPCSPSGSLTSCSTSRPTGMPSGRDASTRPLPLLPCQHR
jgi:hypothetical protein